jgi:hypothetical protein
VDATPAANLIRGWLAEGMSVRQIATQTRCGRTTIADLCDPGASGRRRIAVSTLRKILSACPQVG